MEGMRRLTALLVLFGCFPLLSYSISFSLLGYQGKAGAGGGRNSRHSQNGRECIQERFENGDMIELSFSVAETDASGRTKLPSGSPSRMVSLVLSDPRSRVIKSTEGDQATFSVFADVTGLYTLCFTPNRLYPIKVVNLEYFESRQSQDIKKLMSGFGEIFGAALKGDHLEEFRKEFQNIASTIQDIKHEQKRIQARDNQNLKIVKANSERVVYWAAVEAIVMISVSLVQIMVWRRVFSTKQNVNIFRI